MKHIITVLTVFALGAAVSTTHAQDTDVLQAHVDTLEQKIDSIMSNADNVYRHVRKRDVVKERYKVITNHWYDNSFLYIDGGINAFYGDKPVGRFVNRLTPQVNFGIGTWFSPAIGIKIGMMGFGSRGDKGVPSLYTGLTQYYDSKGNVYYKEKTKWWCAHLDFMLNITRLIVGYEGRNMKKNMNQFLVSFGIGATHHMGLAYGSANEWTGIVELNYKRYFKPSKKVSLDVKWRTMFYDTEYDGVFHHQKFDINSSFNVGLTFYLPYRGWSRVIVHEDLYMMNKDEMSRLNDNLDRLNNVAVVNDTVIHQPTAAEATNMIIEKNVQVMFPYLVNFVIDKVEVVNRERVNLRIVAEMMKALPDRRFTVYGYADKYTGTVKRNIWLAEHRADNVFKVLTEEFGVSKEQLVIKDFGGVDNMFYDDPQLSRSVIIDFFKE